jgi:hypothetical protein
MPLTSRFRRRAVCFAVTLLFANIRLLGFRLIRRVAGSGQERAGQFSLRMLILAVTASAIAMGLTETLRPALSAPGETISEFIYLGNPTRFASDVRQNLVAGVVAAIEVASVWSVLRPGLMWPRLLLLGMVITAVSGYLAHLGTPNYRDTANTALSLSLGLVVCSSVTSMSVLPVRLMGYRLESFKKTMHAVPVIEQRRAILEWGVSGVVMLNQMVLSFVLLSWGKSLDAWQWQRLHGEVDSIVGVVGRGTFWYRGLSLLRGNQPDADCQPSAAMRGDDPFGLPSGNCGGNEEGKSDEPNVEEPRLD